MAADAGRAVGAGGCCGWGAVLAAAGGLAMLPRPSVGFIGFAAAGCVFLFSMGLVSPTGAALALTPFASQAGQASALLGFLQMAAAALLTTTAATLPGARMDALALVLLCGAAKPAAAFARTS